MAITLIRGEQVSITPYSFTPNLKTTQEESEKIAIICTYTGLVRSILSEYYLFGLEEDGDLCGLIDSKQACSSYRIVILYHATLSIFNPSQTD